MAKQSSADKIEKVYFIQENLEPCDKCGTKSDGPIKIGTSKRVEYRVRDGAAMNPHQLNVIGITDGGKGREGWYHQKFADLRIRGEWFYPGPILTSFIKTNPEIENPSRNATKKEFVVQGEGLEEQLYEMMAGNLKLWGDLEYCQQDEDEDCDCETHISERAIAELCKSANYLWKVQCIVDKKVIELIPKRCTRMKFLHRVVPDLCNAFWDFDAIYWTLWILGPDGWVMPSHPIQNPTSEQMQAAVAGLGFGSRAD